MTDLRITTVQTNLQWALAGQTDVVVLPEMFTTGFSMNAATLAETMDDETLKWMTQHAARLDAVLTGSLIIQENGNYYNRLIWMRPDGSYDTYDKRHLFTMADEHLTYTAGTKRLITAHHACLCMAYAPTCASY